MFISRLMMSNATLSPSRNDHSLSPRDKTLLRPAAAIQATTFSDVMRRRIHTYLGTVLSAYKQRSAENMFQTSACLSPVGGVLCCSTYVINLGYLRDMQGHTPTSQPPRRSSSTIAILTLLAHVSIHL
jgi:hypothetical protein